MGGTIGVPCEEGFSWLFGSSVLGVIRVSTCEGDLAGWVFFQAGIGCGCI